MDGHTLRRVTGWEHGLRSSDYGRPYRWLDSTHLLLFPLVGEQEHEMLGAVEHTLPVVVNLNIGFTSLHLSPSGRRLLVGFVWHDLETGQMVDFSGQHKWTMGNPGWSSDETRLFDCCFGYADANLGGYGYFWLDVPTQSSWLLTRLVSGGPWTGAASWPFSIKSSARYAGCPAASPIPRGLRQARPSPAACPSPCASRRTLGSGPVRRR